MTDRHGDRLLRIRPDRTQRARALRKDAPFPERLLWGRLRSNQIGGLHFRRQHPIGPYIVDFYCHQARLVIEVDGVSHDDRERFDAERTSYLQALGLRVLRFSDDEVLNDLTNVVYRIAYEAGIEA